MPNATIATSILSGTITNVTFINAIRDALISVGYTLFDTYNASGTEVRVLALVNSAATKGTIYLQISVNANNPFTFSYQMFEGWNTTTRAGTNGSAFLNYLNFSPSTTSVNLYTVNHPEAKLVVLEQGTIQAVIGIIRPKTSPPSWWNENNFAYAFQTKYNTTPTSSRLASTTSPFGNAIDYEYLQLSKLQDGNAQNNNARSIFPLCVLSAGVGGIVESCTDLIVCASNTARPLDTITVSSTEVYTYIWGTALNSGIAIRTVGG